MPPQISDHWQPAMGLVRGSFFRSLPEMSLLPARCLVARGCTEGARMCERLCVARAIRVQGTDAASPGPAIEPGRCDLCGLCARACPAGAIEDQEADLRVAVAVRERLADAQEVVFGCDGRLDHGGGEAVRPAAGEDDDGAVVVPCLGSVGVGLLALAAAWGARGVRFDDRRCAGCARRPGLLLARRAASRAARLAALFGREVAFDFESRAGLRSRRGAPRGSSRRRLLSRALGELVGRLAPEATPSTAHPAPRDRLMLKLAVQILGAADDRFVPQGEAALWSLCASAACDACGLCAALCPVGGLRLLESGEGSTLVFDAVRCTGCELCVARCPRGALAWSESVRVGDVARPPVVLARANRRPCGRCKQPVLEPERLCPDCRLKLALAVQFGREGSQQAEEKR